MQLFPDGPDIPNEIIQALEEDKLILFCGAGISMPAGLPSFKGLLDQVCNNLDIEKNKIEEKEYNNENYDRVFGLIEQDNRFGREHVRKEIINMLEIPSKPYLDYHKALIKIATTQAGNVRLITTNFDLLFKEIIPNLPTAAAPMLPIPKPNKWNSLVYLHGVIQDADPNGENLIVSSSDFGVAYLVERWASRFISDLFNYFTILFIGYRVNDPVMRYLIDALAAERTVDKRIHKAYAFAEFNEGDEKTVEIEWKSKNISPVLYNKKNNHKLLVESILAWADIWTEGLISKENIVNEIGIKNPQALHNEEISKLLWAISDPSGAIAIKFSKLEKSAPIEWLKIFEQNKIIGKEKYESAKQDAVLVDWGNSIEFSVSLPPITRAIAQWLSCHLDDKYLINWIIDKGNHLHPEFKNIINLKLENSNQDIIITQLWHIFTSNNLLSKREGYNYKLNEKIKSGQYDTILRLEILNSLEPRIKLSKTFADFLNTRESKKKQKIFKYISDYIHGDCDLVAGQNLFHILELLRKRSDWPLILKDIAFDLFGLLKRTMDLLNMVNAANINSDLSYMYQPSIAPHRQNKYLHEWTFLIDLLRESIDLLFIENKNKLYSFLNLCLYSEYPIFRRFVFYIIKSFNDPIDEIFINYIRKKNVWWLWTFNIQVELYDCIPHIWKNLNEKNKKQFLIILFKGPPKNIFRRNLSETEFIEIRDESIWKLLIRLDKDEKKLPQSVIDRLNNFKQKYPNWIIKTDDKSKFPSWMETKTGYDSNYSSEELNDLSINDFVNKLLTEENLRQGLLEQWKLIANNNLSKAINIFEFLIKHRIYKADVWEFGIYGVSDTDNSHEKILKLLKLINKLPNKLIIKIVYPISHLLQKISNYFKEVFEIEFYNLWDKIFKRINYHEIRINDEPLTEAINHPAGHITEALLVIIQNQSMEKNSLLPFQIRTRLEKLVRAKSKQSRLGRILISSRLSTIFYIDPNWATKYIIPLLDWRNIEEASSNWQGFLWSPRIRPSLWINIKYNFMKTFDHISDIGQFKTTLSRVLASIAIESHDAMNPQEIKNCIRKINNEGRETILWWICDRLEGSKDKADTLWSQKVRSFINKSWPKDKKMQSSETSEIFAQIIITNKNKFPEALSIIEPFLVPVKSAYSIVDKLKSFNIAEKYPEETLSLLNKIVSDDIEPWFGNINEVLEIIKTVQPKIVSDSNYKRLKNIVIKHQPNLS